MSRLQNGKRYIVATRSSWGPLRGVIDGDMTAPAAEMLPGGGYKDVDTGIVYPAAQQWWQEAVKGMPPPPRS